MRRFALIALLAGPVEAADWVPMDGAAIRAALTGATVRYSGDTAQDFRESGRTLYTRKGRDSWGYWEVRGDRYCSQWPPSELWACYDMARQGDAIRFIGAAGDTTDGVLAE